jgi:hypothetical protein
MELETATIAGCIVHTVHKGFIIFVDLTRSGAIVTQVGCLVCLPHLVCLQHLAFPDALVCCSFGTCGALMEARGESSGNASETECLRLRNSRWYPL